MNKNTGFFSPQNRCAVVLTGGLFFLVLVLVGVFIAVLTPRGSHVDSSPMAEPVNYEAMHAALQKHESENLKRYAWSHDRQKAEVPLNRAIEILEAHPEGLHP